MMVVEASALIAILEDEDDVAHYAEAIAADQRVYEM